MKVEGIQCDYCPKISDRNEILECSLCGSDVCKDCAIILRSEMRRFNGQRVVDYELNDYVCAKSSIFCPHCAEILFEKLAEWYKEQLTNFREEP